MQWPIFNGAPPLAGSGCLGGSEGKGNKGGSGVGEFFPKGRGKLAFALHISAGFWGRVQKNKKWAGGGL